MEISSQTLCSRQTNVASKNGTTSRGRKNLPRHLFRPFLPQKYFEALIDQKLASMMPTAKTLSQSTKPRPRKFHTHFETWLRLIIFFSSILAILWVKISMTQLDMQLKEEDSHYKWSSLIRSPKVGANGQSETDEQAGNTIFYRSSELEKDNSSLQSPSKNSTHESQLQLSSRISREPLCQGKESFAQMVLSAADYSLSKNAPVDLRELCKQLPMEKQVVDLYGPEPVILGLDTCEAYRKLLQPGNNGGKSVKPMPRVAGLYHTGTNALARSFHLNIEKLPPYSSVYSPYDVPVRFPTFLCVLHISALLQASQSLRALLYSQFHWDSGENTWLQHHFD